MISGIFGISHYKVVELGRSSFPLGGDFSLMREGGI